MLDIRKLLSSRSHKCPLIEELQVTIDENSRTRKVAMKALSRNLRDPYVRDTDKLIYCQEWLARYYNDMIQ